ncbi:helix-turn-helix domain-containing protein [Curtobacterium sp. VKM Ac-1395]|uniref:helix-turn-helix domain-containing protein n=1 Tax=Curtobacterium sp. VKM Ac-1395 TaxID=2783815 RepID=UPI001E2AFEA2|nr:helix-turn-helix domain-containing protein [Curtobacterium sp. VKM Ac-1395]
MTKTTTTLEKRFPLTGRPGLLLEHLISWGTHGLTISEAARATGLSVATARRALITLEEAGLTDTRLADGRIIFDNSAPHAAIVRDAVQTASGDVYPRKGHPGITAHETAARYRAPRLEIQDALIQTLVPDPVQRLWERGDPDHEFIRTEGPTTFEARAFALRIRRSMGPAVQMLKNPHQAAYSAWKVEEDRATIHRLLHIGEGTRAALDALEHGLMSDGVVETPIHGVYWAHATYALAAETRLVADRALEFFDLATSLQSEQKLTRDIEREATQLDRQIEKGTPEAVLHVLRGKLQDKRDLLAGHQRFRIQRHGRTLDGYSAARMLYGLLEQYYALIAPLAIAAAEHPAFQTWQNMWNAFVDTGERLGKPGTRTDSEEWLEKYPLVNPGATTLARHQMRIDEAAASDPTS